MFKILRCLLIAINDALRHDGIEHAGYLSFLVMLSIFPFLVLFMAIVGILGSHELSIMLQDFIIQSSWASFIDALKPRIVEITSSPPQTIVTIAVLSAIWTASSIFEAIRTILNRCYRVKTPPPYITRRLISILEFLIALGAIVAIMLALVVIPYLWQYVSSKITINLPSNFILTAEALFIRNFILYCLLFIITAMLYKLLPNRKSRFIYTFPGSSLMVIFSSVLSFLFQAYLSNVQSINFIYGSIAGIIIALLYFYFCSLIFIIGGEFNYQCEKSFYPSKTIKVD
jgi:membrane protein